MDPIGLELVTWKMSIVLLIMRYSKEIKNLAVKYRLGGKMYPEINDLLKLKVPKATMSFWFKKLELPSKTQEIIKNNISKKLVSARKKSVMVRNTNREKYLKNLNLKNVVLANKITNSEVAKIALAMLCLGEASKSKSKSGFYLGNSDYRIIVLFIKLLKICFEINDSKFRFTIQCRADQDILELEKYWRKVVKMPFGQFYKPRVDSRTKGKPTLDKKYKGVLRVDYIDKKTQLDLESLADMIYNRLS